MRRFYKQPGGAETCCFSRADIQLGSCLRARLNTRHTIVGWWWTSSARLSPISIQSPLSLSLSLSVYLALLVRQVRKEKLVPPQLNYDPVCRHVSLAALLRVARCSLGLLPLAASESQSEIFTSHFMPKKWCAQVGLASLDGLRCKHATTCCLPS